MKANRIDPFSVAGKPPPLGEHTQLLVIGCGAAGLAAAIAAAGAGLGVVLVDENPVAPETMASDIPLHFGGRASGAARNRTAMMEAMVDAYPRLAEAIEAGVDMRLGTEIWGLFANGPSVLWLPGTVAGLADGTPDWLLGVERVIVAAGRCDMGLGFPGWSQPGVMGATAAVRLAALGALDSRRAVILGSTPEGIAAADALRAAGVEIAAIVEPLPAPLTVSSEVVVASMITGVTAGPNGVTGAEIVALTEEFRRLPGTTRTIACDGAYAAYHYRFGGHANPHRTAQGYAWALQDLCGRCLQHVSATGFVTSGGRVTAVETDSGRFGCDSLVIAAGPATARLAATLGVDVPMVPARAEMLVTEPLPLMPLGGVDGNGLYGRQTLRGNLAYGGGPHEWLEPDGGFPAAKPSTPLMAPIAARLAALLPRAAHARIIRSWAGIVENTPDGRPIIDRLDSPANVTIATLSGVGFGLSPASGHAIRVIRAFYNTCCHRGFRLCDAKRGQAATLLCPYHHWGYRLDGTLARAAAMGDDFDKSLNGLRPIHLRIVAGTMYVCLADAPPDFAPYTTAMTAQLAPHGLERAKLAAETRIVVDGNWKLTMENSRECYHCAGQHKELTHSFLALYDFENPDQLADVQAYWQKWRDFGIADGTAEGPEYRASRLPLINGAVSITNDGEQAVKRTLGDGPADAYGSLRWVHYPSNFNHAINDYAVLIRMLPLGPEQTVITTKWLVDRDAEEGRDYNLARLMETWDITNEQDKRLIERNQAGVRSRGYVPGPYSPKLEAGWRSSSTGIYTM